MDDDGKNNDQDGYEEIVLRTGVDPLFFAETLTVDVELVDAIFDLIDNSIDAARDKIISQQNYDKDQHGLPKNYSQYHVTITLNPQFIEISDNCLGIDQSTVETKTFYTGENSDHKFGVGFYGIGLKRALLKVGKKYKFVTDNGINKYEATFEHDVLSGDKEKELVARKTTSDKIIGTSFKASNLKIDTINQITSLEWWNEILKLLSIRYSIYVGKGFEIKIINECHSKKIIEKIQSGLPEIRNHSFFPLKNEHSSYDDVNVFYEVGIHDKYRYKGEPDYKKGQNDNLTEEFGTYFICNDRVIISASFENKHGFLSPYHSEYGGFLCFVHMVSESANKLPWNTAKTDLKTHSPLFLSIREKVEPLAKEYRSKARKIIKVWNHPDTKDLSEIKRKAIFQYHFGFIKNKPVFDTPAPTSSINPQKPTVSVDTSTSKPQPVTTTTNNLPGSTSAINNNGKHTQNWETLLYSQFPISEQDQVLDNMIIEGVQLKIKSAPHASLLLYRSLLEGALRTFAYKTGNYQAVKDHYYSVGDGKTKNHSDEYKKSQGIGLAMILHWLLDNPAQFPEHEQKKLTGIVKKSRKHATKLNDVVHCKDAVSDSEVILIRNETIELLKFLVTLGSSHKISL